MNEIEDVPETDFTNSDDNFFEKINEKELCDFEESLFEKTEEYLDMYMS